MNDIVKLNGSSLEISNIEKVYLPKGKYTKPSRKLFIVFLLYAAILLPESINAQQIIEVDEVEFKYKGTKTLDEDKLEDAVAISGATVYKKETVGEDILKLKKFYFDNGFFEAEVDTSVSIDYDDEEAIVTFIVTENTQYKIDSFSIGGVENVSGDVLSKLFKIKSVKRGDNYSKALIIQQGNEILDTLQNNGYMNARLHLDSGTIVTRFKNEKLVNVRITVEDTDTVFYFGKTNIDIKNNIYGVRTEYPREEITYKEGEVYGKAKRLDSERNITKITIISSAKLNPSVIRGNIVDFTAEINLNKKNELTPYIKGANYENRFYVGGGIRYFNRYFLQTNKTMLVELEEDFHSGSINRTELSGTMTAPHFIARALTFIDKLSIGFENVENYKNYFIANQSTVNYFIAKHTFYNNAYLDLTEELIWIKYDTIATGRQTQLNTFLSITLEHDNTNNILFPSRGFFHSILAGTSGLLPKLITGLISKEIFYSQFFKAYTLNKLYIPLSKVPGNTVFATSIKIGDIIEYGSGENLIPVQPTYKFFSGGSSSVRGWYAKENGILDDKLNGGTFLFEGGFELRKRLFPKKEGFMSNLSGAVFLDYGNVWETHKDFKASEIALGIGFGIRYNLFIGPIRFDFGFRLYDPQKPDGEKWLFDVPKDIFTSRSFAFHFAIGEAF